MYVNILDILCLKLLYVDCSFVQMTSGLHLRHSNNKINRWGRGVDAPGHPSMFVCLFVICAYGPPSSFNVYMVRTVPLSKVRISHLGQDTPLLVPKLDQDQGISGYHSSVLIGLTSPLYNSAICILVARSFERRFQLSGLMLYRFIYSF